MKNLRAFLWIGLALILFVNYQTWNLEYAPQDAAAAEAAQTAAAEQQANAPPTADVPDVPAAADQPPAATGATSDVPAPVPGNAATADDDTASDATAALINVRTDVLDVDISLEGGQLVRADLLDYRVKKGEDQVVRLLRQGGPDNQYLLQTGLNGAASIGGAPQAYPTHHALFTSDFTGFRLEQGLDELRVPLKWTSPEGVEVIKTLIFHRGSYRVDVQYEVMNDSMMAWSAAPYAQIVHDMPPVKRSYFNVDSYSFIGPAYWDGSKYQKLKLKPDTAAEFNAEYPDGWRDGWVASLQHHFVVAIVPPSTEELHRHTLTVNGDMFRITDVGPTVSVEPGASAELDQTLFVGPKLQHQLAAIHPELDRAADFGKLTFIAQPLFWLLEKAHKIFGNWGFAIIVVTFLLKLAFYPLSEIAGRTSAKMKMLAPRLKQLQEQYKDDRTKLGQATMELYKKEGANPATGCLPMLIQLPVFMAFYWVLLESVEMRQAPFIGWIHDLSSRDPLFILPVIMAAAMFLQYKIQPTSADPTQAKVMMIMPIVMSVTFAFFPAGLVLYWVTNTILTILQQWNINRRIEAAGPVRN
jgi:YidC/Oxa1 family membrane protein insertase